METADQLQQLGLIVGRVVDVSDHPGARAPSYLLTVDLGPQGRREATMPRAAYEPGDLDGTQVVCAPSGDELLVVVAHSHAKGAVLLCPEREVEDGSIVG